MEELLETRKCRTVRNMLADYSVENLNWFAARKVRAHLSHCVSCSREFDLLLSALEMVEEVGHREPPAGMWHGVYNRLTAGEERTTATPTARLWGRRALSLAGGLAVILLALGLTISRVQTPQFPDALDVVAYEYVEAHAALAQGQPFADKINLALVAAGGGLDKENAEF